MLKRRNKKCGEGQVFKLSKDILHEKIARETFEGLLKSLIQSHSIKLNVAGNRECLSLPQETQIFRKYTKRNKF